MRFRATFAWSTCLIRYEEGDLTEERVYIISNRDVWISEPSGCRPWLRPHPCRSGEVPSINDRAVGAERTWQIEGGIGTACNASHQIDLKQAMRAWHRTGGFGTIAGMNTAEHWRESLSSATAVPQGHGSSIETAEDRTLRCGWPYKSILCPSYRKDYMYEMNLHSTTRYRLCSLRKQSARSTLRLLRYLCERSSQRAHRNVVWSW